MAPEPEPGTTLRTERLILRPMVATDAEPLLGVFADPEVMASFRAEPFDLGQVRGWVERNLAHQREHGYGLWTITLATDGRVIGDCGLEWQQFDDERLPELGYDLRRDAWGHGYATEAARAVRDHAFSALDLPVVVSAIRRGNDRSVGVARRLGMHPWRSFGDPPHHDVFRLDRDAGERPDHASDD
ncbi:MAG TPA: GNAT family N-acetyltransferase [Thermomicrobiales bacterium]|jgi:RimJ/RimL family protein N-acetyltransferase|nr:GNAT family N-acetyltransferase [Thermomicrobiales bacterium]